MKATIQDCPGCNVRFEPSSKTVQLGLHIKSTACEETFTDAYCSECSRKILDFDRDVLSDQVDYLIKSKLKDGRHPVSISEGLVREIARNLGASDKLCHALVERIFGKEWTGEIPEGARMNEYQNRDRLVAFVAAKLNDLWTLEA